MSEIHQVTLEILRHGPAHNQLLSPLTRYLVLCGNHSPETLEFPWEHQELMAHLRILRYKDSLNTLSIERRTIGRRLAAVLGEIKSLISELSPRSSRSGGQFEVTELRLVLSSEELALIPFELALTPEGCPGAGEALVLQNLAPLTITRQVRRVNNRTFAWPKETQILFATAAPGSNIPTEAHMLALRKALAPWIPKCECKVQSQRHFERMVQFLPGATWASIAQACRERQFSHVHILAHGLASDSKDGVERFGLALHHPAAIDKVDFVDGSRLVDALRGFRSGNEGQQSFPAVVTLATCDGGNAGSLAGVLGSGSSIAHTLHESGIPFVLASQFPLTFRGSAIFAETVYTELLRGKDPRLLMSDLRRRLHGDGCDRHDWASLVCYCAWPPNFERQLADHRLQEADRSARFALKWADQLIADDDSQESDVKSKDEEMDDSQESDVKSKDEEMKEAQAMAQRAIAEPDSQESDVKSKKKEMEEAQAMAQRAIDWLKDLCKDPQIQSSAAKSRLRGLLASAEKRLAEVMPRESQDTLTSDAIAAFCRSRAYYRELFVEDPPKSWAIVQYLVLECTLRELKKPEQGLDSSAISQLWTTAHGMASHELWFCKGKQRAWALASLIELGLLALILERQIPEVTLVADGAIADIKRNARELARSPRECHMEVYSTRRQLNRYRRVFGLIAKDARLAETVEEVLAILPVLQAEIR